jgi:tetratricopeptide (TPR) repeat protein
MPHNKLQELLSIGLLAISLSTVASAQVGTPAQADAPVQKLEAFQVERQQRMEKVEALLDRTGDMEDLGALFAALRIQIDQLLQRKNPKAVATVSPHLDKLFATERIRGLMVFEFESAFREGGVDEASAWALKPSTVAIHEAMRAHAPRVDSAAPELAPSRKERLVRFITATALVERTTYSMVYMLARYASVLDSIDPTSTALKQLQQGNGLPQGPTLEEVLARMVAPALAAIPDADLDEYIAFAESHPGRLYFRALGMAQAMSPANWAQELESTIKMHAALPIPTAGEAEMSALMEQARHLMYVRGTQAAKAEAQSLLLRAEQQRPDDAEIQTMLGECATHTRSGPRPDRDQLRVPTEAAHFAEAERYLRKAIELDPTAVRAYALLGRAKFLQGQDEEAASLFAKANAIDPEQAWLRVNMADLASAQGRYDEAIALYRKALDTPERESHVHSWALIRSRIAFRNAKRLDEYAALGRSYLQQHPEDVDYPYSFAEHFLEDVPDFAQALEVLKSSSETRNPPLRNQLMAKALAGRAQQSYEDKGVLDTEARAWLGQALEFSGGDEYSLMVAIATPPVHLKAIESILQVSKDPGTLATQMLQQVLMHRDFAVLKTLALAGADLDRAGGAAQAPPLVAAVMHRDVEMFSVLLEIGADPSRATVSGKSLPEVIAQWESEPWAAAMKARLAAHGK